MSADILNLVANTNKSKAKTADKNSSKSVGIDKTSTKSLFDNLLKSVSTQATVKASNIAVKDNQITKKQHIKTDVTKNQTKEIPKNDKPTSLLDKLILDAKSELKTVKKVADGIVKPKEKTDDKIDQTLIKVIDKNIQISDELAVDTNVKSTKKNNSKITLPLDNKILESKQKDKYLEIKKVEKVQDIVTNNQIVNKILNQDETKSVVLNVEVDTEQVIKKIEIGNTKKNKEVKKTAVRIIKDSEIAKIETQVVKTPLEDILLNNDNDKVLAKNNDIAKEPTSNKRISLIDQVINATKQNENFNNPTVNIVTKDDLNASIILSGQKSATEINKLKILNQATTALEEKTVTSVKKSADMLGLNVDEIKISKIEQAPTTNTINYSSENTKVQNVLNTVKTSTNNTSHNNLIKDIPDTLPSDSNLVEDVQLTKTVQEKHLQRVKLEDKIIEVIVPNNAVKALQAKIIGARQQASSFMSDVARNMYLNYKAPLTAFRMNLNPANLGQIAIVMKSNKSDNSINISMNMSNSNTLDAFIDNKTALQNALNRTFDETSSNNVSLNFGMQSDSSNQSFEQSKQEENSNNQQKSFVTSSAIVEEVMENTSDYM